LPHVEYATHSQYEQECGELEAELPEPRREGFPDRLAARFLLVFPVVLFQEVCVIFISLFIARVRLEQDVKLNVDDPSEGVDDDLDEEEEEEDE